ncbi:MAG: helix-turn-helix transcriptional regulator [Lachnospiraceae bacterium]|nr:helix-turn-helix transcriptional regulator [Lachnospiraceae bacterium]
MTVAENIKRIRKEKHLTQKQLGEKCGMSESTLRQYEIGYRNPKIETIRKIANALEVELWEIVELNEMDLETRIQEIPKMTSQLTPESIEDFDRLFIEGINENTLLKNYRQLNNDGQQKVSVYVEDLAKIPEYRKKDKVIPMLPKDDPMYVNAAHADDYANAPEELKQLEEDIMNDENF